MNPTIRCTRLSLPMCLAFFGACAANPKDRIRTTDGAPTAIHQEVVFKASPQRVYDALTDARQFAELTGRAVAELSREPGGKFSCFDGIIIGRQIELIPGQRIVEAWREVTWPPGVYSIAKFELTPADSGTKLSFDQAGFPDGAGTHLAIGWGENYWEPLRKYLGE